MVCANNLRQIGLALHNYHWAQGKLPPGNVGPIPTDRLYSLWDENFQFVGSLAFLLPYVEQESIYNRLNVNFDLKQRGPHWWTDATNWTMAQTRIKGFLCPSTDPYQSTKGTAVGSTSVHWVQEHPSIRTVLLAMPHPMGATLGRTNYVGVSGAAGNGTNPFWSRYEGIFTDRSQTRLTDILDGTSNTLMFGEAMGGFDRVLQPQGLVEDTPDGLLHYSMSWMGVGAILTCYGMDPVNSHLQSFSSAHPGVVQFCFADGSVRPLKHGNTGSYSSPFGSTPQSSPWWVLQELAGMRDGDSRDRSGLEP
jgi:prepilin-type processing-associated H-X9-DG protein